MSKIALVLCSFSLMAAFGICAEEEVQTPVAVEEQETLARGCSCGGPKTQPTEEAPVEEEVQAESTIAKCKCGGNGEEACKGCDRATEEGTEEEVINPETLA